MDVGRFGEQFARIYVERSLGWQICFSNWRCRAGELDIVAKDRHCLVVIEVRTKQTLNYGSSLESINQAKMSQLRRVIPYLLRSLNWSEDVDPVRLDVIALTMMDNQVRELLHLKGVSLDG
jgi:putative endonuclease